MSALLNSILNEHRSIAAVLHGMRYLVGGMRAPGTRIDTRALRAMLYYLDVFPERVHHPKEEELLFAAVRRRTSEADAVIEDLRREHREGGESIRRLEQALLRYEEGGEAEFEPFVLQVERFVQEYRDHMRREEQEVIETARRVLTDQDWASMRAAWATHRDPLSEITDERDYDRIIARVVDLAPPPIGFGRPV